MAADAEPVEAVDDDGLGAAESCCLPAAPGGMMVKSGGDPGASKLLVVVVEVFTLGAGAVSAGRGLEAAAG